ncbi:MAG: ATP-binding protein [Ilumatobacter sp.]
MTRVHVSVDGLGQLGPLRDQLRAALASCDVDDDTAFDVELATSEVVTNGLQHGCADSVGVDVDMTPDRVFLTIAHQECGDERPSASAVIRPIGVGGHGLKIVRELTSDYSVTQVGMDRRTSFTLERPRITPPQSS